MANPSKNQRIAIPKKDLRDFIITVPALLLVAAAYLYSFRLFGVTPSWGLVGLGALGWVVALNLRLPFIPLVKRMEREKAGRFMAILAGPCEELVRLAAILIFGRTLPIALSIGIGWGVVEILYTIFAAGARTALMGKDDEKARQAKAILEEQGMLKIPAGWLVGVWERLFATGIHVGFTLLMAWNPWLVLVLTPVHSLIDLAIPLFVKRSIWIVEGIVTVAGGAAVVLGLLAFGLL